MFGGLMIIHCTGIIIWFLLIDFHVIHLYSIIVSSASKWMHWHGIGLLAITQYSHILMIILSYRYSQ